MAVIVILVLYIHCNMFSETTRANIRNVSNMVNFKLQTIYDSGLKV